MSYILDALRRADAERGRGNVPGLNAQPVPAAESTPVRRRPALPWLAGAGLALAGGAVGWFLFGRTPEAAPPPPPQASPAAPAAAAPQPTPAPPPVAVAPSPLPLPPLAPQSAPPPVPIARAQPPAETPAPAPEPAAEKPAPKTAAKGAAPAAPAASAVAPAVPWNELPDEVKRQLPTLAMGGAIWSEVPSARMLIVSGQLVREGDTVAPNLKLEQIKPRSAVLAWKGLRYEVPY